MRVGFQLPPESDDHPSCRGYEIDSISRNIHKGQRFIFPSIRWGARRLCLPGISCLDHSVRVLKSITPLGKLKRNAFDADGRLIRGAAQAGSQRLVTCRSYLPGSRWGPKRL